MKTLIKGATLVDGTGNPSHTCDLLIENQQIAKIEKSISPNGTHLIEANGKMLTPGFIDVHSHSDFTLLVDPRAEGKVFQGVSTEVIGNCGQSAFPLVGECQNHLQSSWDRFGLKLDWEDLAGYRRRIEASGIAVNVAPLMGQGNVRASVMGYEDREPTEAELAEMKKLVAKGMGEGAFGMSTGLIYLPGTFSKHGELVDLMREVGKQNGIYATHLRCEGEQLIEAIEEAIQIATESGSSLQISHLKTWGKPNWEKCLPALSKITHARAQGLSVHFDRYPYIAASTDLDAIFPAWVYDGGKEEELERLKDPRIREKIRKSVAEQSKLQKDFWETIVVSSVVTAPNKKWEGSSIKKIASALKKDPIETVFDLLIEERLEVGAIFFAMCEENLKRIVEDPHCMVGSDSCARPFNGPLADGKYHPRTYGTFPRFFAQFVRQGEISWEEAVRRATSLPAEKFGIPKRGRLEVGYFADLVLFDPQALEDCATFEKPNQPPKGIDQVWVNGELVLDKGEHTGKLPGQLLSKN